MLSRISSALGCGDKDLSDDYLPEDSWLSASAEATPFFVVPTPSLQDVLQKIGISRCKSTGQLYLAKMPFLPDDNQKLSSNTPWATAHSAQKRCRHLETFLKTKQPVCEKLCLELRQLASVSDENITHTLSTFSSLLCPLLTDAPDSEFDLPNDDILILFGPPATAFQILLFTPCLCCVLTDLILELVANHSAYSEQLLKQFRQPIGLGALFSTKQTFSDISTRLIELFQIAEEPRVQAKILEILPDLASSPCSSGCILSDEDRSLLVLQLIDLFDTISLENQRSSPKECNAIVCLIECLTSFSVQGELTDRLYTACFDLLDRCGGRDFYFDYLPVITRCLLINGPAVPQTSTELSKLVTRLRTFFTFAKSGSFGSTDSINSTLVDLLRVAFQFNRNITSEWVRVIGLTCHTSNSPCDNTGDSRLQNQAVQDFIVLCVVLSTPTMTALKSGGSLSLPSGESLINAYCSSDSSHYKRLKKEVVSLVRRLLTTERLFSFNNINGDIERFLIDYGELLFSRHTRLFPSFSFIINQLITSGGLIASRFKFLTRYIGLSLYMKAFTSCMSDYHQRLEIISHLVHHSLTSISNLLMRGISRFKTEAIVNANLVTILRLAQSSAKRLGVFETSLHALQNQVDSSGASYDSKANRLEHSCMLHGYQSGILYQKEYIKHIFSILAFTAFGIKEHRKQQDNLLSLIRRLLSSESLFSKCVGIIGAVVVMEVICRRDHTSNEREHSVTNHSSMDEDVSTVLASQLAHVDSDRSSTSTVNTSRSSNASSLSLKGPGTGLADDPAEINLLAGDSEEDRGANCSSHSPYVITPPNRLLLQLVGLVEHAIRSHIQLMVFWLDELAFCFNRLTQLNEKNGTSQSVLNGTSTNVPQFSEQGRKLIEWMGARIKRNFQDDFVLDNTSTQNYLTQFSLHDPSLCEIAIALGPSWDRCRSSNPRFPNVGTSNSSSVQKFNRIPNPLLLPAHLNLVAIVVTDQHDGNLDTIDALLGCPLLLPTGFANSELTQLLLEDESISIREPHLAIMTVNWFIEAVNVFAPKLLLTNSSSSQNFHFEAISSTHVSNSARIYCLSILLRLSQIAKLRHCLYRYLVSVYGAKDTQRLEAVEIVETETPNPESNCAPTNNTHEVSWSNLRLPTATYQPATCFSNFTSTSCYKEISQPRFSCGVHLQSFLSSDLDCAFARKRTGVSSKFGTCSNGKEPRAVDVGTKKRRKVCDTSTKSQLNEICDDQDSNASGLSEPTISQDESSTTQLTGSPHSQLSPVPKKRDKKSALLKSSKMASVGTKKLKKSNKNCLMPTLLELTACFRELDLSAIVLGLSSWPWSVKFSSDQMSESNYVVDWTVLTWLLEELSIRLDHITGVSPPVSFGWNAFERLTNLSESVKISYFSYMIPYIISALMRAVDYFTGMTKHKINNDVSVDDVILSSSSSSDEDDSQKVTASKGLQSSPLASKQVSAFDDGVIGSVFSGTGYQISSVLCICLRSLLIFMNGLTNVSSNVDKYLFYCTNSQIIDSMSAFTYDSIQIVANCCKSKIRLNASREIVINEKGVIMLDRCNSLVTHEHDNQQNALFLKRMDEVEGKYFVDVFNENNDLLPVQKEINNLPKIDFVTLSENLRSIIEYLMKNIWPSSLPHANAALFHCRLVFYLTSLYYACHNSLYVSSRSIENAYWVPDLFSYTRDLLDQDWDTSIKWKGQTYRDCLQALLSFHLRCHFYRYEERCSLSHSTNFLVEFTQKRLVPAVQRYKNINDTSTLNDISDAPVTSYRTLNRQTIDVYCREVMETVVWISKHLCNLAKRVSNPTNLVHLDESSIVAQWNQCVEVLCCITNFFQKSTRQSTSKMIKSNPADKRNPTIHLLPSVMRTGRLFLQGLLKGAMPLLSSLFRHRGVEVTTFLKNTQQLTRFLQRICNHAKAYRDSQLTNQIPATRRCLETFVYKVKIMLSQNHCLEAFWLGTLKNRDLHGVELPDDNDSIESDTEAPSTTYQDDSCSVSCSRSSFGDNRNSTSYQAVEKLSSTSRKGRSSTMNQVILGHVDGESVEQEVEELDDETVEEGAVLDDEEDLTEDDGNSDVLEATDEEY